MKGQLQQHVASRLAESQLGVIRIPGIWGRDTASALQHLVTLVPLLAQEGKPTRLQSASMASRTRIFAISTQMLSLPRPISTSFTSQRFRKTTASSSAGGKRTDARYTRFVLRERVYST